MALTGIAATDCDCGRIELNDNLLAFTPGINRRDRRIGPVFFAATG